MGKKIFKWVIFALAVAVNVFIIVNGFIEGETSSQISNGASQIVIDGMNTISPGSVNNSNIHEIRALLRKLLGHVMLPGVSGVLSTLSFYLFLRELKPIFHYLSFAFSMVFGFIIGMISELAQLTAKERVFSMVDVGYDCFGYFVGLLFVFLVLLIAGFFASEFKKEKQAK